MKRREFMLGAVALAACTTTARASEKSGTLHKTPGCECCDEYAMYLRQHGISIEVIETSDMAAIKKRHGVPEALEGCHSTFLEGFVIEGHVPIAPIKRLLSERPNIKGISLPGMEEGSPGMTGRKKKPFTIYEIADGAPRVFSIE